MSGGLRQSQSVLHTWSGLLVGWILFGIFLAGTVSFWRDDLSRWARPELAPGIHREAALAGALAFLEDKAPGAKNWSIELSGDRDAGVLVRWQPQPKKGEKPMRRRGFGNSQWLDGQGQPVEVRESRGGEFFYRLHFDLHYVPVIWARWVVGFCAIMMLVAIVSGIITHKKIFKDFFTFRPGKGQRSWLDGHNATAVLALPFHLMITYTGLVTLMTLYMPWGALANYPDQAALREDLFPRSEAVRRLGEPAALTPLAPVVARAEALWGEGRAATIRISEPGDAAARIEITRSLGDRIVNEDQPVRFDGVSGALISAPPQEGAGVVARGAMIGLHAARFADLPMRWLYFLSGLAGTVMVGSGLALWTSKRRERLRNPARPHFGFLLVERLNIGFVAGMPLAMTGFLWGNRLLPIGIKGRAEDEISCMFVTWGAALIVALLLKPRLAWSGLFAATAASLVLLAAADLVITDTGLVASLACGDFAMAAMETSFLVIAAVFVLLARQAWRRPAAKPARQRRAADVQPAPAE
ncbi:PepSY-associated TM helix domain-containing protein [Phenylobacterium sp. LjRoot219]|uniref:PepSY-associated TM helix domain-containing protein n=1 Tax=Phenylobacterium sp. LjRoot219 TaxID=3342283 RepID=UPI003ECF6F56